MEFHRPSKKSISTTSKQDTTKSNLAGTPFGKREMTEPSPRPRNETILIASRSTQHSARDLCESETSRGPDFISHHEGLHCDMTNRELKPLCDGSNVEDCFAWEPQSRVVGKRNVAQVLDYGRLEEWD
ncbi:MAG: hypothetical protein M1812_006722 [Candelaria pacifica]|nr:MAG: hypothetical protein M1812_006722 [Candelaria pacifica]